MIAWPRAPRTARHDIDDPYAMRIPLVETVQLYTTASRLAISLAQHVFDTLYHAVAFLVSDCSLVTADDTAA